ncbi:FAD-binding oxidoreductase [Pseudosulfitobacter pseudonitzschiae]|uniref:FAD-binding oxidoreductase n=1 Tax=Pseudosulfitobacter pseudonitzschiae TaxID=1402135 RepID=UPI001AF23FEF|nr:FAD-linked oxidase C-terminal domain-containing protein [Pseudosulfitobacter pseudonitzschiae]MBM1816285.1 FAD-binding protein [Pseudosulfitobacter pseudonitzschiae]MBM1833798.1 FAD-binding protein [Pseudosulfitobacter pseudonitzschiae]MBM1838664.1 FAD-binding protein [Pseudosulfitobacter pseudonitzschiae]MBM1843012.1 FAD-binding protein [Pseudosulfitobacter pseudonitzschiae]MBM1847878.1 FAD-binding protein [Pseudosulfitobacter pseudonitzschiae]
MAKAIDLPRNESGIKTVMDVLKQQFGDRFQTSASVREQHGHTTTWIANQMPDAVVFAKTTQEVSDIVKACAAHKVPVIAFGTGTSLEGHVNAAAGGISIDLSQMNKIIQVHSEDLDCVIQPGVTREDLNTHLRDQGLFFPIDPGANASLGGMAATRASGTNAVRYGTMKDNVLALEAVMADGRIIRTAQRAKKSSAGYDLTRLLVGSEGTLGIITEITLKLQGIPEAISSARCSFPSVDAACQTVMQVIQFGIPVARIELLDTLQVQACNAYSGLDLPETPLLLLEFHGSDAGVVEQAETFGAIAEEFGGTGYTATTSTEERNALWKARHNAYWASLGLRPGAKGISTDVCVPISRLAEIVVAAQERLEELGFLAPIVGHVGDGNFHSLVLVDENSPEEMTKAEDYVSWLAETAISMDGTCTGEHGVGQGKMPYLVKELGEATDVMIAIKRALDPDNILNPGKVVTV